MADNFSFNEGNGRTGAAKDVGGVLYPEVINVETDGSATGISAKLGSLTETAPATDTASSGINGRLQRIAQRITSLIALVPTALTGSGNFKTAISEWVAGVIAAVGGDVASGSADSGNPVKVGTKYNSTPPTFTDGQRAEFQVTSRGIMKVSLTQPNSTSELAGLADNADAVAASSTTNKIPFLARLSLFNGSTWDRMRGDTTGLWGIIRDAAGNARGLNIDANGALAATVTNATASNFKVDLSGTGANTTAIKVDGSAVTQPVSMATNTPVGNVAHDAADSGNPIKVGGRARTSEISQISNDDRSDFITDTVGKQIVLPYANPENFVKGVTGAITDTTSTSTIAAQGAGIRTYITSILVTNSHASTGTFVKILDGSTIIWEGYAAPGGGGFAQSFPTPLRGTANTAVNTQCVTTGANVIASIAGYKGV